MKEQTIIKLSQTGNVCDALKHFALEISWGKNVGYAFESGVLYLDNQIEEDEYCELVAKWKSGQLKIEVKKMIEVDGVISGWETVLI